jgi:transcription initiation factor TFIIH subunit 4
MDTSSQVRFFMLQYLNTVQARNMDLGECLSFLFQLSFAEHGKDYSTAGISGHILAFLQHLREFGLVYQKKRSFGRFYPTRLELNIASGESERLTERHRKGYLVVETNFRVYAYTISDLKVALIGLFAEMVYRLPNLAVAVITRDSIREALRGGISASQIVRFLRLHAHPQQQEGARRKRKADRAESDSDSGQTLLIPPTVVDQIYLWEKERDRFSFRDGVLYNHFLSQTDFDTVRNRANSIGACVWANDKNRAVVVTREGSRCIREAFEEGLISTNDS